MIRKILCPECNERFKLHPEDKAVGFQLKRMRIEARKPAALEILMNGTSYPIEQMVCDGCNLPVKDGDSVFAVTMWRGETFPDLWEIDYTTPDSLAKCEVTFE